MIMLLLRDIYPPTATFVRPGRSISVKLTTAKEIIICTSNNLKKRHQNYLKDDKLHVPCFPYVYLIDDRL